MTVRALDHFGRVGFVVGYAGIAGAIRPTHEITCEERRGCLINDPAMPGPGSPAKT